MVNLQNKYDILNPIARSRESDVFLVRQKETSALFLLKSIKQNNDDDIRLSATKRFFHEIEIVSSLDHPNIAKPHETFLESDTFSILYDYEKGDTLSRLFEIREKFAEKDALNIIKQLLNALSYIHNRGIIHCDINPHNIFITESKGVKLLDFGFSVTEDEARKIPEGQIIGTFPYLSPEQMGFTQFKIDTRTDLYCATILLYRMLAGIHPFTIKENSMKDLLDATIKRELSAIKHVPKFLNLILLKGLRPTPSERYQTAEGLISDISFALDQIKNVQSINFIAGQKDAVAAINRKRLFVVREDEIEQLHSGLKDLLNNKPKSFLIYGKSGIGKTEIVKEFKAHIDENKFDFISAKCNHFTPNQPYSIFRRLILEILLKISNTDSEEKINFKLAVNKGLSEYSGIICRIIPEMREWFEKVGEIDIVEIEKEADRTIHVLSVLSSMLCAIRKLVIFVDDFQWIDRITFDVLIRTLEQKVPCLLICNYRTKENEEHFYNFGQDIKSLGFNRMIQIKPFTINETKALITHRFGALKKADELAEALFVKTEGVPFVLTEAIRYLVNHSFLNIDSNGWCFQSDDILVLPTKFDLVSLILNKLEDLSHEEKKILRLASLIEGKFDCEIIEKLGEFPAKSTYSILTQLENQGFISRLLKGDYSFIHDKIQEAITSGILEEERFFLFERLGRIYLDMAALDKEKLFNAAECYLKSKNIIKAMEICYLAAEYASEKIAFDVALRYFKNALLMVELSKKTGIKSIIDKVQVTMAIGNVLILTGANEQALTIFEGLNQNQELDKIQRLEVKYKIGTIYRNMGEFEKSASYFIDALREIKVRISEKRIKLLIALILALIEQIFLSFGLKLLLPKKNDGLSLLKAQILNKLSYSLYFSDMLTAFYIHFKALNLADLLPDCFEKVEAYSLHQVPVYQMMMKKRAFKYLKKSIKTSKNIHRIDGMAFARCFGGLILYFSTQWKKSEDILRESIDNYGKIGDIYNQILSMEHIARVNYMRGLFNKAIKGMEEIIDLCKRLNEKYYLVISLAALNFIKFIETGSYNKNEFVKVDEMLNKINSFFYHMEAGAYLLQTEIILNKLDAAYVRAKKMLSLIFEKSINSEYQVRTISLFCYLIVSELINRLKGLSQIQVSTKKLKKDFFLKSIILWFSCLSYPAYWGSFYRNIAWFFSLQKHNKIAGYFFKKSIKCHHKLDMRYEEACSIRDYGTFLDDFCNQPGMARDQFNKAYELFSWCGAKFETNKLENRIHPSQQQSKIIISDATEKNNPLESDSSTSSEMNQIRLDTLRDISTSITELDDVNLLLKQILSALITATGAQYGCLVLNQSSYKGYPPLAMSFEGNEIAVAAVPAFQRLINKVNETNIIPLDNIHLISNTETNDTDPIKSDLCVPLNWRDKFLGYVYLVNDKVRGLFGEGARKAAQILAAQAGIALENVHLMNQYKELNLQLQHQVQDQTNDITEKNKRLEEINLKMIDSERMKNLLSSTLVHDIKNYIVAIDGNMRLLEMKFPDNEKIKRTANIVTNSCMDIVNLTSNLLDIAKMEEGKLEVKKERLTSGQLCEMMEKCKDNDLFAQKEISIEVKSPDTHFEIEADSYLLNRIFQNLFNNAAKYSSKGGSIVLSFLPDEKENIINFYNSGTPIPDENKERIFEKYERLDDHTSAYSKGLGLFFCRMVMNAHGGRIWLESDQFGNHFKMSFKTPNYNVLQKDMNEIEKMGKGSQKKYAEAG